MPMKDYVAQANQQTFLLIQMEEPDAVDQAEAIASLPGVDMIMLGPADFSVLTGIPGQLGDPSILAAIKKVAAGARNAGKHWAATCGSMEQAKQLIEMGCRLLFYGADIVMVKNGLESIRSDVAKHLGLHLKTRHIGDGESYMEK